MFRGFYPKFLVLLFGLIAISAFGQPVFSWVKGYGGVRPSLTYGLAVDSAGSLFLAGSFGSTGLTNGVIDFGSTNLTSAGGSDGFLAKCDQNGACVWAARIGGTGSDELLKVTVTQTGDVYVTGDFAGTAALAGKTNLNSEGQSDFVVAKFSAVGAFQWAFTGGGSGSDSAYSVKADDAGNCYVTGSFQGIATFGHTNLTATGIEDAFFAKLRPDGSLAWVRAGNGSEAENGSDLAIDSDGNCLWAGEFSRDITLGAFTFTNSPLVDSGIFLARYDANGGLQFARRFGNGDYTSLPRLGVDRSGIYVAANYSGAFALDQFTLPPGLTDVMLAKLNPAGTAEWVQTFGGNDADVCVDLAVDSFRNSYLTGHFRGTANVGTNSVTSSGNSDVLIAAYGPTGNFRWVRTGGGTSPDLGLAAALDNNRALYFAGTFSATATFGSSNVTSSDILQKAFLARYELAPALNVSGGPAQLSLSWPTNFSEFRLQTSSVLAPTNWSDTGVSPVATGRSFVVTTNATLGSQLFRLSGP